MSQEDLLVGIAKRSFDAMLTQAEELMLRRFRPDGPSPPQESEPPTASIRGELIRWLLTDEESRALLIKSGLYVRNVVFDDAVNLSHCVFPAHLVFLNCHFALRLYARFSRIDEMFINGAKLLQGADFTGIEASAGLGLSNITSLDSFDLSSSRIGILALSHLSMSSVAIALNLASARILNSLHITNVFFSGCLDAHEIRLGSGMVVDTLEIWPPVDANKIPGLLAIDFVNASVTGSLTFGRLVTNGAIAMSGLKITGDLSLPGAIVKKGLSENNSLVYLNNSSIEGNCDLRSCVLEGWIEIVNTKVDGSLILRESSLWGIMGDGLQVRGLCDLRLSEFKSRVSFVHAVFSTNLKLGGCTLQSLIASNAKVGGTLDWIDIKPSGSAQLVLDDAIIRELRDDKLSWPPAGKLSVLGAKFTALSLSREDADISFDGILPYDVVDAAARIDWLSRQENVEYARPQPWVHLSSLLNEQGDKAGGKRVLHELRKYERRLVNGWAHRLLRFALSTLEREPLLIFASVLIFALAGTTVFAPLRAHFSPTGDAAYKAAYVWKGGSESPPAYPSFSPFVYALENVLPGVKLGQDDRWAPDRRLGGTPVYLLLVYTRWILILAGWGQGVIIVAALSARFQK